MPVELRKRKAVDPPAAPPAKKKGPVAKVAAKVKEALAGKGSKDKGAVSEKVSVGETIALENFGGEITTNAGETTTLKKLVDASSAGVVIFTYTKASTSGCTTQACLFRDSYAPIKATGYAVYGLSMDSPKSNTTFKEKNNLPYELLCDPNATLIAAIGLKKAPSGIQRGVFVIDKTGKVLAAEPGSPSGSFETAKKAVSVDSAPVATEQPKEEVKPATNGLNGASIAEPTKEDIVKADVAADVADTAAKLDKPEPTVA